MLLVLKRLRPEGHCLNAICYLRVSPVAPELLTSLG